MNTENSLILARLKAEAEKLLENDKKAFQILDELEDINKSKRLYLLFKEKHNFAPPFLVNKILAETLVRTNKIQSLKKYHLIYIIKNLLAMFFVFILSPYAWYDATIQVGALLFLMGCFMYGSNSSSAAKWVRKECEKDVNMFAECLTYGVITLDKPKINKFLE